MKLRCYKKSFCLFVIFSFVSSNKKADYNYIGAYRYKVYNYSLLNNCYLSSKSYGYVISDLNLEACGVKLINADTLNKNNEYIITLHHPVKFVYTNSKKIIGEDQKYLKKKPVDIVLDTTTITDSIYIYKLKNKGIYRLLLP